MILGLMGRGVEWGGRMNWWMGMPRLVLCVCTYIALFFLGQGLDWIGVFCSFGFHKRVFFGRDD